MSTYPYAAPGRAGFTVRQIPVFPSRQFRHRPQAILNGTVTRSPTASISTSEPFSMISPVISWPRINPGGAVVRPRTICWSDPQMLVVTTFRITPCGASLPPNGSVSLLGIRSFGYAIDCTSTSPGLIYATPRLFAISPLSLGNFSQLSDAPNFDPLHDENIAFVVEAGAVRANELPRDEFVPGLIAQGIHPIRGIRIPQVFDDLVVLVHQRDSAVKVRDDDVALLLVEMTGKPKARHEVQVLAVHRESLQPVVPPVG